MAKKAAKKRLWLVPLGTGLVILGLLLLVSLVTWSAGDPPMPDYPANERARNACGKVGAWTATYTRYAFGWASYGVAVWVGLAGVSLIRRDRGAPVLLAGAAFLVLGATYGLGILQGGAGALSTRYVASPGLGGGVLGILLSRSSFAVVGRVGSLVLLALLALAGLWLVFGVRLFDAAARLWGMRPAMPAMPKITLPTPRIFAREGAPVGGPRRGATIDLADPDDLVAALGEPGESMTAEPDSLAEAEEVIDEPLRLLVKGSGSADPSATPLTDEVVPALDAAGEDETKLGGEAPPEDAADETPATDADKEEEASDLDAIPVETAERRAARLRSVKQEKRELDGKEYKLPPLELLETPQEDISGDNEAEIREKAQVLERTVNEFNIKARVVRIQRGPVITMYELALAAGIKVSRVEALADDLAMALKAPNVRIVAPLPGKSTVGVEVPNTQREIVQIREIAQEKWDKVQKMAIPLFLGRDAAGTPLALDLSHAPHMLIAGQTGSGKSVCINSVIMSIMMTRTPDEVQLLLIDPKSVELADFKALPHLISPVVVDMKKAAAVLDWACKKMQERYALLARVGARNIGAYNRMAPEEIQRRLDPEGEADLDDVPLRIPYVVIIVDELGELMMVAAKEVENSVIRLSQKSRAVGIHLICATQRPSVDVITGLIKANLPCRIAFQVSSKVDSRTILDRNGAEKLLGRGDMLFLPPGTSGLVRGQGGYVSDEEIRAVTEYLSTQAKPRFSEELRQVQTVEAANFAAEDDLYIDACRVVMTSQRGSVSLLQRKLGIGYGRAARLIDMMAEQGLLGEYKGSQPRECQLSLEEWEAQLQALSEAPASKGKKKAG
jgi:S-DNA-T family DNA segregation ATPase FtsK/SpoIIIE